MSHPVSPKTGALRQELLNNLDLRELFNAEAKHDSARLDREGYFETNDGNKLYVAIHGSIDPNAKIIVRVHGGPCFTEYMPGQDPNKPAKDLYEELYAKGEKVVIVDVHQAHAGLSAAPEGSRPGDVNSKQIAGHFAEILQELFPGRKAIFHCGSFAGIVIRDILGYHPELVAGFVVRNPHDGDPDVSLAAIGRKFPMEEQPWDAHFDKALAAIDAQDYPQYANRYDDYVPPDKQRQPGHDSEQAAIDMMKGMHYKLMHGDPEEQETVMRLFFNLANARNALDPLPDDWEPNEQHFQIVDAYFDWYLKGTYENVAKLAPYLSDDTDLREAMKKYGIVGAVITSGRDRIINPDYLTALHHSPLKGITVTHVPDGRHGASNPETGQATNAALLNVLHANNDKLAPAPGSRPGPSPS